MTNPIDVNEGQTIWLAWVFETNPGIRGKDDSPNSGRAASTQGWASGMPTDFGSSTTSSWIYSIYANYTPDQQDQQIELIGNPYMFTGRRFDLETGLYYYRARYYNPYIGRFLQTDPIGYGDGMNWYKYCGNNPLNFMDPSGNWKYTVSIPLETIWDNASSGEYDNPAQHKSDVDDFLIEAGFYQACEEMGITDIQLLSVSYSDGTYEITFGDSADLDVDVPIEIKTIKTTYVGGYPVFVLNKIGLLDERALNKIIVKKIQEINNWYRTRSWTLNLQIHFFDLQLCDTPFFYSPVHNFRYNGKTSERTEVNYIGIGHALAYLGVPSDYAWFIVCKWKNQYNHDPSSLTWYWWNKGYKEYGSRMDW